MDKTQSSRKTPTTAIVTGSPSAQAIGVTRPAPAKGANITKARQ